LLRFFKQPAVGLFSDKHQKRPYDEADQEIDELDGKEGAMKFIKNAKN
jgi:hypothetical protein